MSEPTVCAVVLTCNRWRKSQRSIAAILAQSRLPEKVLVVDNCSTDGTRERVAALAAADPRIVLLPLAENEGPAGGYAAGFEWAEREGFDYAWAFADDVYANPDCLEILLEEAAGAEDLLLYPSTIDEATGGTADYPQWSGLLLPMALVRRGGLPQRELFWWIEDTEYLQWRLPRRCGARQRTSARAIAVHGIHEVREKAAWKYYYEVRNTLYYRLRVQDTSWLRRGSRIAVVLGHSLYRPLCFEKDKLKKLRLVIRGAYDGVRGTLGKTVDPAGI